jgi:uncharacterized protein (TIGR03437 family)
MLALFAGAEKMLAVNALTATPASITLSCNTATGPGANATIVIKSAALLTGNNTVAVTVGNNLPAGVVLVSGPQTPTFNASNSTSTSPGFTYVFNYAAGCAGATATTTATSFNFKSNPGSGAVNDVSIAVTPTVVTTASALSLSPSPVTITCVKNGGNYTPGPAKTVTITSAATGGSPVATDTVTPNTAAWATVGTTASANANPTTTFTVVATAGCGSFNSGTTNTTTVNVTSAPAPPKALTISLQTLTPTTLIATPTTASFSYVKGSGSPGHADINITASAGTPFFAIDTTTLPIWLTADAISGSAPKSIRFSNTSVADSLAPGTYSGTVSVSVSGQGAMTIPVSLLVTNAAPKLTVSVTNNGVAGGNITWNIGSALPTPFINAVSSDSPISYAITTNPGTLNPIVANSQLQGLAYSFGTPIAVTFDPLVFAAAQPGSVLTGTVTLKWGNPVAATVVTFNITIASPGAAITSISPSSIPTASAGQTFTVSLSGSGFVPSTDPSQKTKVGIIVSNTLVPDTNIAWNVVNSSNIILTITVPATADSYLPFATTTSAAVVLGVCNPGGSTCSIPTGNPATLTIATGPLVQAVTNAASFVQVSPGTTPSIAPYDMISIFGTAFCPACTSTQVVYGVTDANLHYPTTLALDGTRNLVVKFINHSNAALVDKAPILFATNSQINVLVPSTVSTLVGAGTVDIVVTSGTVASPLSSTPFNVTVNNTDPGIFTVGADGQGGGAILNSTDYSLIRTGNEAGMRSIAADSDTVLIYMTGLGIPDSSAANDGSGANNLANGTDCIAPANYFAAVNTANGLSGNAALTSDDGLVLQPSLVNSTRNVPCMAASLPTVKVGNVSATVTYAGWVSGSIAGLYQINARLPGTTGSFTDLGGTVRTNITQPYQLPVVVTFGQDANSVNLNSQSGVGIWVAPRLLMTAPSVLAGNVGAAWSGAAGAAVIATEGSGTYHFAVTGGTLPTGLVLNQPTNGNPTKAFISGTPQVSGAQLVTITATDYAAIPVSGSVSFTLNIGAGLFLSATGAPFTPTHAQANANVGTITATGGVAPYNYVITSGGPAGCTIGLTTGVIACDNTTTAGNNSSVLVTVTDSTSGTPLTNTITFAINIQ